MKHIHFSINEGSLLLIYFLPRYMTVMNGYRKIVFTSKKWIKKVNNDLAYVSFIGYTS
jgi:hypothetical protein